MKEVILQCPNCYGTFDFKNWFVWVLHSPMHWFGKRYTKCIYCGKWSWMKRENGGFTKDIPAEQLAEERALLIKTNPANELADALEYCAKYMPCESCKYANKSSRENDTDCMYNMMFEAAKLLRHDNRTEEK